MYFIIYFLAMVIATEAITEFFVSPASLINQIQFWFLVSKETRDDPKVTLSTVFTRLCAWCFSFWVAQAVVWSQYYVKGWFFCSILGILVWRTSNYIHTLYSYLMRRKMFTGASVSVMRK